MLHISKCINNLEMNNKLSKIIVVNFLQHSFLNYWLVLSVLALTKSFWGCGSYFLLHKCDYFVCLPVQLVWKVLALKLILQATCSKNQFTEVLSWIRSVVFTSCVIHYCKKANHYLQYCKQSKPWYQRTMWYQCLQ